MPHFSRTLLALTVSLLLAPAAGAQGPNRVSWSRDIPTAFAEAVYNYQILPDSLINLTAIVLPWLELVLGVLLILGVWIQGTTVLSTFLLMIFMGAIAFNFVRGLDISCGCFSASPSEGSMTIWTIMRDAVFLLLAVYLFFETFFLRAVYNSAQFEHKN